MAEMCSNSRIVRQIQVCGGPPYQLTSKVLNILVISGILEKKHLSRMIQHFYGTWSRLLTSNTWSILNEWKDTPFCLIPAIRKKINLYGWTFYRGLYQPLKLGEHTSSNTDLVSMFFGIAPVFNYWFYNVQGEVSPGILVGFGWSRFWLFSSMIQ